MGVCRARRSCPDRAVCVVWRLAGEAMDVFDRGRLSGVGDSGTEGDNREKGDRIARLLRCSGLFAGKYDIHDLSRVLGRAAVLAAIADLQIHAADRSALDADPCASYTFGAGVVRLWT